MKKFILIATVAVFIAFACLQGVILAQSPSPSGDENTQVQQTPDKSDESGQKDSLKLTNEQKEKIKAIKEEAKEKIAPLKDQVKTEKQKLEDMKKNNAKPEEINAQKEKLKNLKNQLHGTIKDYKSKFMNVLTPEQRTKFKAKMKERREKRKEKQGDKKGHWKDHQKQKGNDTQK